MSENQNTQEEQNITKDKNKGSGAIIAIAVVCVLGVGALAYNHFASTKSALILTNTAAQFKKEVDDINESNNVINAAKDILGNDYSLKVGTKTDDMYATLDYTQETNSYYALLNVYGFEYDYDLGQLPINFTSKGFEYTGESQVALKDAKSKYTSSLGTLLLESEVSNTKASDKTYDREIKFVVNKDKLNELITTYDKEITDIVRNQLIPEVVEEVNNGLGIPLDASTIEDSFDFANGYYGLLTDSTIENDIEITILTDDKKAKEIIISLVGSTENETITLAFNDVNNYLNSESIITLTTVNVSTGEEKLKSTVAITPVFNESVWSAKLYTTESSNSSTVNSSIGFTWKLDQIEDNVVYEETVGDDVYTSSFTLAVDENQNIYYNKQGSLFNIVASLSRKEVTQ